MLVNNVPILEEWVTLPTAAQMLGVTKQTVHNMVAAGKFPSVHTISGTGKRNIYVVRRAEVDRRDHRGCGNPDSWRKSR